MDRWDGSVKKENKREGKNPAGPRRRKEKKKEGERGKRVRKRGKGKSVAVENCFQATRGNLLIGCPRSGR